MLNLDRSKMTAAATVVLFAVLAVANIHGQTRRPAPAKAQTQTFRAITVKTQPGATIWLDGVRFGRAAENGELEITTVSAGAHLLRVRADGYKEFTHTIPATRRGAVDATLTATTDPAELAFQEAMRLTSTDREKAAEAFRKAISLRANFPDAHVELARVLTELGDIDDAIAAIESAKRFRPAFAEASAVLGRIYKDDGNEAKAIAAFKRAITEGKGFQPEAYTGLGLLYKEKAEALGGTGDFTAEDRNFAEASGFLRTALRQLSGAPDSVVLYQTLGLVYERQKKNKEAIAIYREFLSLFPDSNEATAVRSYIELLSRDDQ
jgi:tetratricopeptide (TPR) repeat protein